MQSEIIAGLTKINTNLILVILNTIKAMDAGTKQLQKWESW